MYVCVWLHFCFPCIWLITWMSINFLDPSSSCREEVWGKFSGHFLQVICSFYHSVILNLTFLPVGYFHPKVFVHKILLKLHLLLEACPSCLYKEGLHFLCSLYWDPLVHRCVWFVTWIGIIFIMSAFPINCELGDKNLCIPYLCMFSILHSEQHFSHPPQTFVEWLNGWTNTWRLLTEFPSLG